MSRSEMKELFLDAGGTFAERPKNGENSQEADLWIWRQEAEGTLIKHEAGGVSSGRDGEDEGQGDGEEWKRLPARVPCAVEREDHTLVVAWRM